MLRPEVFEGRPSRKSDQYSLAIVYQEMLTAVLPFPGRTAAQLAAQHLNAKPRLSRCPKTISRSIGKALSKKPTERFNSCRELVDALDEAGNRSPRPERRLPAAAKGPAMRPHADGDAPPGRDAGESRRRHAGRSAAHLRHRARFRAVADRRQRVAARCGSRSTRSHPHRGQDRRRPAHRERPSSTRCKTLRRWSMCRRRRWMPNAPPLRPTLFIGLGGCGSKVLRRLRRRLDDRLPPNCRCSRRCCCSTPTPASCTAPSHGEDLGRLRPEETLAMPLRRSQDYREDSRQILEWLSRRWLFNIPRSLQTEGLRPLGRLALVDHAEQVTARLKQAIEKLHQNSSQLQLFPRVVHRRLARAAAPAAAW